MRRICAILFILIKFVHGFEKSTYLGCYKYEKNKDVIYNLPNILDCFNNCEEKYFKYATWSGSNKTCFCTNQLGELREMSSSGECDEYSVYLLKNTLIGPPKNFHVTSLTEEGVEITWEKPENADKITSYEITANVLHTFSQDLIQNTSWVYYDTNKTVLNLQPASRFNLNIRAGVNDSYGIASSLIVETLLGVPDNKPVPPKILKRNASEMIIKILPVVNNNGPITYYQLIVLSGVAGQYFQPEYLQNYEKSLEESLQYYIAAELSPSDIQDNFKVGDGKNYGNYFNAPLLGSVDYNLITGIVSIYNNQTKAAYSDVSLLNENMMKGDQFNNVTENDTSTIVILLVIGITLLSILLIASLIGFLIIRKQVLLKHRHNRLSEQELTLQGPMITLENSAYLTEDEQSSADHYKNLKKRLKIFSLKNELFVNNNTVIGTGKFGTVCEAVLNDNGTSVDLVAYCIPDKSLNSEQRKLMLKNLDMLLKSGKHDNIIELVGASESSHMLYVLLKVFPLNLKQYLLQSRVSVQNRFCKVSESLILRIITQISHGLFELEKNKICHNKLCAANIMLTEDLTPKIFGFGLADYIQERELDCSRWSAVEILRGHTFTSKSSIWSFGVLLWEICALGATPYSDISNINDLTEKILQGTRLPQLKYFNDDLYQIMLNCWQVDMDERPSADDLCRLVEELHQDVIIPYVSFQLYQTFQYEQYKPELELL